MASRRENALDLAKFVDNGVRVKLSGGREGEGERGGGGGGAVAIRCCRRDPRPPPSPPPPTVEGVLKGYDQLLNLVLDEAVEFLRGEREKARRGRLQPTSPPHHAHPPSPPFSDKDDLLRVTDATRPLGLCVLRGTAVMAVAPTAGAERLAANPFAGAEEAG